MKHPSELVWFKLHARDLSIGAWISFRAHAMRCEECKARLARETSERAEMEGLFDDRVTDRLGSKAAAPARSRGWVVPAVTAAAFVAILLLFVRSPSRIVTDGGDDLRAKGGTSVFLVYVASDGGTDLLGETCHTGDALQAQYRTTKSQYLVVGVDPDDIARTLVPLDATTSTATRPGLQGLPQSWVLDAAPGRERFVAFFSDSPIDGARAREAAKQAKPSLDGAVAIVRECTKKKP